MKKVIRRPTSYVGVARLLGGVGLVHAVLLFPAVFQRLFSLDPDGGTAALACLSAGLAVAALVLLTTRMPALRARLGALLLGVLAIIDVELAIRSYVRTLPEDVRTDLRLLPHRLDEPAFVGHPFIQYMGNPGVLSAPDLMSNNFGFSDADFVVRKPDGVLRVACLGGSTTMQGYPHHMETFLRSTNTDPTVEYEVMNFGMSAWATIHSMFNFIFNVLEFSPDYVVIHHAWNEREYPTSECQRWDYLGNSWSDTQIPADSFEGTVLRASVGYRWLKKIRMDRFTKPFVELGQAHDPGLCRDDGELWAYRRHIETIIAHAAASSVVPVLTTQPYNRDLVEPDLALHFDVHNAEMRDIVRAHADEVLFVDLAELMKDKSTEAVFADRAHCHPLGLQFKAAKVGTAILEHRGASVAADAKGHGIISGQSPPFQ